MKGAQEDESGTRTVVFKNKFGERKEKINVLITGELLLPRISEVGENKKTLITGDHKEMKEDVANPGNEIPSFYGKFASTENTQRSIFLVSLKKEIVEEGGYRYMPK